MGIEHNVAGVWKTPDDIGMNVAGVWKTPDKVSINVAGVWKDVWPTGPTVSASANGDGNFRFGAICYAGAQFTNGGIEYEYTNTGGTTSTGVGGDGTWLDAGAAADVWVNFVRTGGTKTVFDTLGSARYNLGTTRGYRIQTSGTDDIQNITGYFQFYDAASGGNLLQQTSSATWTAERADS
jgi:hypothetical protein